MDNKTQLQNYAIWSNFIYLVSGTYSIIISYRLQNLIKTSIVFFLWGLLIMASGITSIFYHINNPSWTDNPKTLDSETYKNLLKADMSLSISSVCIGILFLIYRIRYCYCNKRINNILHNSNFWFALLFMVLSAVFFFLSNNSFKDSINCKDQTNCFDENLDDYDVFHSNWHIFSGITSIFWLITLNDTY